MDRLSQATKECTDAGKGKKDTAEQERFFQRAPGGFPTESAHQLSVPFEAAEAATSISASVMLRSKISSSNLT